MYISEGEVKVVKLGTTPVNLYSLNWSIGGGSYWLVAIATSGTNAAWQINPGASALSAFISPRGDMGGHW